MNKIDVSECKHYKNKNCIADYLLTDMDFSEAKCELCKDCDFKQLARKTQECEELKEKLTDFMNGEYCANGCAKIQTQYKEYHYKLIKEIDQLKTENEELKKILNEGCLHNLTLITERRVLLQTLTEIKDIAKYEFKELMNAEDYHNMTEILQQILQKISEVEK